MWILQIHERERMVASYVSTSYPEANGATGNENKDDNKKASVSLHRQIGQSLVAALPITK